MAQRLAPKAPPKQHPFEKWIDEHDPKLTQAEAAERLEVSDGYLSLVLSGGRGTTFELAIKMSELSGIPLEEFKHFAEARCRA